MKALSKVSVAVGMLTVLLLLYAAAYWYLFKSTLGPGWRADDPFAPVNQWRDRVIPFFAPAAKVDRWWTTQQLRGAFVGTWVSYDKRCRATIKSDGSIRVWGFGLSGFSDGQEIAGQWLYNGLWGTGVPSPVVLIILPNTESSPYFHLVGDSLVYKSPLPAVSFRRDTTSGEVPEP